MKYIILSLFIFFYPTFADAFSGTISVDSDIVEVGESFNITISGSNSRGVTGLFIYYGAREVRQWVRLGTPVKVERTWRKTENSPGTYSYCGVVSGYVQGRIRRINTSPSCVRVEVVRKDTSEELNVSCGVFPSIARVNERVTFQSSVSGGTGSYSYSWSGACSGNSTTCSTRFSTPSTYRATLNVQSGTRSKRVTCSVSVFDNEDSIEAEIEVSSFVVFVNEPITITVRGEDKNGLISLGAYYKGEWDIVNVSGESAKREWEVRESIPGNYKYCGIIRGNSFSGNFKTEPYCRTVTVLEKKTITADECSYQGQRECFGSGQVKTCYLENGVLKWRYSSCAGEVSYGYGVCNERELPVWYCSKGQCLYYCAKEETPYMGSGELSLSLLGRKKGDEEWKRELELFSGEEIDILVVIKNLGEKRNIDFSLIENENIQISGHETSFDIEVNDIEVISFTGLVREGKEDFTLSGKISDEEIYSSIEFKRLEGDKLLAGIYPAFLDIFRKWYFWLISLILLFIFFYLLRKKQE